MKKEILISLMLIALLGFVSAHTGEELGHHSMMDGMMGSYGTGWWIFGWLFMVAVFVAIILLIVWLIKQIQKK